VSSPSTDPWSSDEAGTAIARAPAAEFAERCARGELAFQVTVDGRPVFPPRLAEPGTGAPLSWRRSDGRGTVHATTVIRRRGSSPRNVALIVLDEGFRMMSRVEGIAPEEVRVGMRVGVRFVEGDGGVSIPVFAPEPGAAERVRPRTAAATSPRPRPVSRGLRGTATIVGAAESDLGEVAAGLTPTDLMVQASLRALEDCGLDVSDVDGLCAAATQLPMAPLDLGEQLGVRPRWTDGTQIGGSSFLAHLDHARSAIAAGMCEVVLIAYGSTQRSVGRVTASVQELDPFEAPYRPSMPVTAYALAASRHMHEFGTTSEQLAEVAVAARAWAARNPRAWSRDPLTIDDVLASPRVCDPFGVRDCCLVTDGGGAIVVTSAERARTLSRPPVHVLGAGVAHHHRHVSGMPALTTTAAVDSGARAFGEAGIGPAEVDVLQLYDAFTITPILFLEDLGFCAKGEGGPFVSGGRTAPGGAVPMNTNGGGLSYCHPGMYGLLALIEGVRQVRGACGERQVPGCDIALVHGNGGVLSSQATVILGSDRSV
jgi:acetyl-CoA acetyltransferase/uncharacterized OB-fold protein